MKSLHTFLGELETRISVQSCDICGKPEEVVTHAVPGEAVLNAETYLCIHCTMTQGRKTKR